ncbi:MAG: hypothetical protein R3F13_09095 [Prosthecobacter sp.]
MQTLVRCWTGDQALHPNAGATPIVRGDNSGSASGAGVATFTAAALRLCGTDRRL